MPTLSRRQVAEYVADQLQTGGDAQAVLAQLAAYLIEHRQTGKLDLYVAAIEDALANRGLLIADITTARPLDASLRTYIESVLQDAYGTGITTALREHVDEAVIGGIVIETPAKAYDGSIRTMVRRLRTTKD